MSNSYFNRAFDVLPGTLGRSQAIEDEFTRLEQGFDKLPVPRVAADGFDVLRVTGDPSEPRDVVPLSWLQSTFLSISTAASTYLTQANAAATYLTQANAAATYLTQANAASTYLTQANAAATYLTQSGAAATYTTPAAVQAALTAYAGTNLGLPTFTGADALKTLRINSGGSGYEWAQVVESINGLQGAITLKTLAGQALTGAGDINTLSGPLNWAATATLASASTVDIGAAASNAITITGTTTITSLGTIAAGAERVLMFAGALTLAHHATSLILPGGANIVTAAGDSAYFVSLGGGNWRCTGYERASGMALAPPQLKTVNGTSLLGSGNIPVSALVDFQEFNSSGTWTKPSGASWVLIEAIAGGGSGRRSANGGPNASGGSGGEFVSRLMRASDVGATETVTIGAGGAARTVDNTSGANGGNSTFGSHVTAIGGFGGGTSPTTGLPRGTSEFSISSLNANTLTFPNAGMGSATTAGGNTINGGAGGGGTVNGGSTFAGGTSQFGGNGGSANGAVAGVAPGGGGAGTVNTNSGAGASGRIRVYTW